MATTSYRIAFEPAPSRIAATFAGARVADSRAAMVLRETRHRPVYYFPRADVHMAHLRPSGHRTHCPFKGNATWWDLCVGERITVNAAWSYEAPYGECPQIAGYIAFDWDAIDAWFADEEPLPATQAMVEGEPNPHAVWLMHRADRTASPDALLRSFGEHLVATGLPVLRLGVLVRTLHPQMFAWGANWWRTRPEIEHYEIPYETLVTEEYEASPYAPILAGAGGVRRNLQAEAADAEDDFPVLSDLRAAGATDYAAMPMRFSDGQLNILTLVSDAPGRFETSDLGELFEVLPLISAMFEVHALRRLSGVLLDTYLGRQTGARVLAGSIRRGDGEHLHAVIWFSDLRDSTRLTEALPRETYLDLLNDYFDCMAGAVLEHGGEVLKFIGDAVMAIFPVADADEARPAAARDAIAAARAAAARIDALNASRSARGEVTIGFGIALHRGAFTYGNIGTPRRLDFTVIGGAANEAARIESLTKTLGERILVSAAVAESFEEPLRALGAHDLRGVGAPMQLFAP